MRKGRGKTSWISTSWISMIAMVVAVMAASLLLVQVAGAVTYTITVTQSNGGTISPGTVTVVGGTDKTFTITPNSKRAITKLTVDNIDVQPARTYTFKTVSATHTIKASFDTDNENDGIPDFLEGRNGAGITFNLPDGQHSYPPCVTSAPGTDCVDPGTKDVFVVLQQASGGYFSGLNNPLEYVTKPVSAGGLPITVHLIRLPEGSQDTGNRFLSFSSAQKYVRITESLPVPDTGDQTVLGSSTTGTPDQDLGTVYTRRIANHLNSVYGTTLPANDSRITTYIKHTIAHELAHMLGPLAPVYNANFGGYHYESLPNDQIMNQFVYHDDTGVSPVLYIGSSYTSADQAGIMLK